MKKKTDIHHIYVFIIIASVPILSSLYYYLGTRFFNSSLTQYQYLIFFSILTSATVGGYQLFFWVQRHNTYFTQRCLATHVDDYIPFWPSWVWFYTFVYYGILGYFVVTIKTLEQGMFYIFIGLLLLLIQCIFFYLTPCTVPKEWRKFKPNTPSKRFLRHIHEIDNGRNCFPSMHCSMGTLLCLILLPVFAVYSYILILFICLSCLFVKQHQIIDVIAGIALGAIVFFVFV